jgi:hypothetical protein
MERRRTIESRINNGYPVINRYAMGHAAPRNPSTVRGAKTVERSLAELLSTVFRQVIFSSL